MSIFHLKAWALWLVIVLASLTTCYAYSPKIIAHRGGRNEFPENTLYAFTKSLQAGADMIEIDLQLSKDKIVIAYHPHDLSTNTNGKGPVKNFTYTELSQFDAAYNFDPAQNHSFPERNKGHKIPTLAEILDQFPETIFILDLKSLPAAPLVQAIIKVIDTKQAWHRVVIYSTNDDHLNYFKQQKHAASLFESRDITRKRLLSLRNEGICCCPDNAAQYLGFELRRNMVVEESLTMGNAKTSINFKLWDDNAIQCIAQTLPAKVKIVLFGINSRADYDQASKLNAYAIYSDNPQALIQELRANNHQ